MSDTPGKSGDRALARTDMSDTPGKSGDRALARTDVASRLPAQELERAPAFYANKLGLQPVEERAGGLRYRSTVVSLFASAGEPSGQHTQMAWGRRWRAAQRRRGHRHPGRRPT